LLGAERGIRDSLWGFGVEAVVDVVCDVEVSLVGVVLGAVVVVVEMGEIVVMKRLGL
jgi:hypothetical protein